MQVELGPVPSPSVLAWINYAREILAALRADPGALAPRLLDRFESYLDEWQRVARREASFRWSGDASAELVEYMVNGLFQIGERVEDEAEEGRMKLRPPEADKFHAHLVRTVLDALAAEGPSQAQYVEQMRSRWDVARLGD